MTDRNLTPEQELFVESHASQWKVFCGLLAVILVEFGVARLPLSLSFTALVSILTGLSMLYAFLVAWFFMHLKYEGRWIYLMLVPVCVLTVVVVAGLTPDIAFHQLGFYQSAAVADR
jgi:cytochrome c oxidase subunit 4